MTNDIDSMIAESFARKVVRSHLDDTPGAWISNATGRIHLNWDEVENRICSERLGSDCCQLCGTGLIGAESREGMLVFDAETRLPCFYDGSRADLVCVRCHDWIRALHHTRRHGEKTGSLPAPRFEVGDLVRVCGEPGIWTVQERSAAGVLGAGIVWSAYALYREGAGSIVRDDCLIERTVSPAEAGLPAIGTPSKAVTPELERSKGSVPKLENMMRQRPDGAVPLGPFAGPLPLPQDRRYEELLGGGPERKKLR